MDKFITPATDSKIAQSNSEQSSSFHAELNADVFLAKADAPPAPQTENQDLPAPKKDLLPSSPVKPGLKPFAPLQQKPGDPLPRRSSSVLPRPSSSETPIAPTKPTSEKFSPPKAPVENKHTPPPSATLEKPPIAPEVKRPPAASEKLPPAKDTSLSAPHVVTPTDTPFFNPNFRGMEDSEVRSMAGKKVLTETDYESARAAHVENINRADNYLDADAKKASKVAMPALLEALEQGKQVTLKDGKPVITDIPLTPEQRIKYHKAIVGDVVSLYHQSRARLEFASFLEAHGQHKDSENVGLQAKAASDELPIALVQREAAQLQKDLSLIASPSERAEMQRASQILSSNGKDPGSVDTLPIQTRKFLTVLYLGTEIKGNEAEFGKSSAFKPNQAFAMADQARSLTKEILKFDPLDPKEARQDTQIASLFGGITDVFSNPEKYNLYDVVDRNSIRSIEQQLKSGTKSGFDSTLVDMGVIALTAGTLSISRSPKVQAGLEQMLKIVPGAEKAAPTIAKMGGLGVAAVAAPAFRNYAYGKLTGTQESWLDTGIHVAGSLAAAELGGRFLGKGSMLTGKPGSGSAALEHLDNAGSAKWLSAHGYDTTGKLSGLLMESGYQTEAKMFWHTSPNTLLTSETGLQLIEAAGLTKARMASVAGAIAKDMSAGSGVDSSKLAEALANRDGAKLLTIDDLTQMMARDERTVDSFLINVSKSKPQASPGQALKDAGHAEYSADYDAFFKQYGVTTVEQALALSLKFKEGLSSIFPRVAELGAPTSTKLVDAAAMSNRVFDGPGLQRLMFTLPNESRGNVLVNRLAEEMSTNIAVGKQTKIQEALKDVTRVKYEGPSFKGVASPQDLAKSRIAGSLIASGITVGTYNSTAKMWDLKQTENPATGAKYTFAEAMQEAHLPTVFDARTPALQRYAGSLAAGTPGQTLLGAVFLRPGAIHQTSPYPGAWKVFDATPLSPRAWNNLNSTGMFAIPGMSSAAGLGASTWPSMFGGNNRGGEQKEKLKLQLKKADSPIENDMMFFPK